MSILSSAARPVLGVLLVWQVVGSVSFIGGEFGRASLADRAALLDRTPEQRIESALGSWTPAWRAVREHVPEDGKLLVVAPPDPDQVQAYLRLLGLLYPRRLSGAAITRADTDLSLIRVPEGARIWVLDMDSGFGLPLADYCDLVAQGPRFELWRLRTP